MLKFLYCCLYVDKVRNEEQYICPYGNISYLDKESKLNKIIEELNEWVIDSDGRRTEENNGDK